MRSRCALFPPAVKKSSVRSVLCLLSADGDIERSQEVDIALAADVGSLQRLPKTTGNASLLYELALTARNFGPEEATTLGLVSRVVKGGRDEVTKQAVELGRVIACASFSFLCFFSSMKRGTRRETCLRASSRPSSQVSHRDALDEAPPQLLAGAHRPRRTRVYSGVVRSPPPPPPLSHLLLMAH